MAIPGAAAIPFRTRVMGAGVFRDTATEFNTGDTVEITLPGRGPGSHPPDLGAAYISQPLPLQGLGNVRARGKAPKPSALTAPILLELLPHNMPNRENSTLFQSYRRLEPWPAGEFPHTAKGHAPRGWAGQDRRAEEDERVTETPATNSKFTRGANHSSSPGQTRRPRRQPLVAAPSNRDP